MTLETFHHDAAVQNLRVLAASDALKERVTELFIASLGTGTRRAMTPIMAYYSASQLPNHPWEAFDFAAHQRRYYDEASVPCAICGIPKSHSDSRDAQIADFARAGRCSMTPSFSHQIDLEDVGNIDLAYHAEHAEVLWALLRFVESVPVDVSSSELEKRLSAAKLMPKSNLAARLWCLRILSELGVVTNASVPDYSGAFQFYSFLQRIEKENEAFAHLPHRADPVWPLSAGRGSPAVNWALAHRIFPQLSR
ncbi:hypothetical protein [Paracidovorax valerianellae]|uniref:Uncharacterized protein n=1 Tax=Paracidovorax valerianellae TaxID=187868 RepID=A0A1G6TSK0_9BURK|nr:hypothetical protein [Paracidovorax valerianellae]MDA8446923.1 hypothetical protein [Paracidovorax valerianellae]SDD32001.1 hypothetical protein SAMN05192589_105228 [Paracidovorax valerianellae]